MPSEKKFSDCLDIFEENYRNAKKIGFYWREPSDILNKIKEETAEVEEAIQEKSKAHIKDELGDLIHVTFSLCQHYNLSPEEVIAQSNQKFRKRYDQMCQLMEKNGVTSLEKQPIESLVRLWQQAKE